MRIFNVDGDTAAHFTDELVTFSLRSSVQAVECPEGASLTDKDGTTLAHTDKPCYVVVDGEDYELVPAVIFDTIYTEGGTTTAATSTSSTSPAPTGPAPTDPAILDALQTVVDEIGRLSTDVDNLKAATGPAPTDAGAAAGQSDTSTTTASAPGSTTGQ